MKNIIAEVIVYIILIGAGCWGLHYWLHHTY